MSHKTLAIIAVIMLLVFGGTILMYPEIFNPDNKAENAGNGTDDGAHGSGRGQIGFVRTKVVAPFRVRPQNIASLLKKEFYA